MNMSMRVGENEEVGKIGKKSKRSKTKEMDEISDGAVVEEDALGKICKKSKKNKKKEMDAISDGTAVEEVVELEGNLKSRVEKKRKNKESNLVAGEESASGERYGKFDTDNQPEKVKKKKKDKRLPVSSEEVSDCLDAVTTKEPSSLSLKKRDKKLKNTNKQEGHGDLLLNGTQDEDRTVENPKKQKTKKRKLETSKNEDALNEKTENEAEENSNGVGNVEKKMKKKRKRIAEEDDNDKGKKNSTGGEDVENSLVDDGMVAVEKVKMKKKKKKKRQNEKVTEKDGHTSKAQHTEATNVSKRKEKTKSVENDSKNPKSKEKKKVRFSKNEEVIPPSDAINSGNEENEKERLVQGKRFSLEEDEILRAAVRKYIESHCLGDNGLEMVMNCISHREVRNCWKEIGAALPHRPHTSVYYRAHILFEGGERLEWTEEERKMLLEEYEKHGNNWKLLAKEFKRHRFHVKDTWRRIKWKRNRGNWSQEEYQNLFDHVNVDLRAKANEEKKSKHGMLRDNICWSAISDKLSTRSDSLCCSKWYKQLTSSMVVEGIWADSDDYRLLDALFNLDACCIEDVDWDDLIDQRSGDLCRKRWDQMVLHIGLHGVKSFAEQVEVLAKRYCPELLEAREDWESKPLVP